ncbi:tRNA pseudouridine synthase B [Desulfovibrio sp. X2]|uniref:tRNA pseudouridine(55) synthase TruB n=1 Tax=Desulfovibrio sp. X2 TaxID=941449 RepID=UPI00035880CF|nr:tRNA pseudouridine(55) synthase TruB [Desulfovibrio sp. X2]EPR44238.1 tRNA pseudouridine synthase B [Desulfovibrio sp. X2]
MDERTHATSGEDRPAPQKVRLPQLDGVLVLDKPVGPTSADCLNRIKRLGQRKIGHAGTLDPLASGVLVVLLGQATKLATFITGAVKTYRGRLRFGTTTDTYDIQGKVVSEADCSHLTAAQVEAAVLDWTQAKVQEVPAYSAAKHQGKPLYALAREGKDVPVKTKEITVFSARALDIALPETEFQVSCSAGTYVRSLVHSLGTRFGCGAVLTALRREESRPFTLERAVPLQNVLDEPERLPEWVIGLADALPDWPRARLTAEEAHQVKNGVRLPTRGQAGPGARAMFLDETGTPLALAESTIESGDVRWAILRGLW